LRRVAIAAPTRIGLPLTVYVGVESSDHSATWREAFAAKVTAMPKVMDLCRLAGDVDYLLRASFPDMAAYDAFYKRLTDAVPIKNITSHFVMEHLKQTTAYPIDTKSR
jgi:Lrp/AsnC family transcriptional regulator